MKVWYGNSSPDLEDDSDFNYEMIVSGDLNSDFRE